MDIINISSDEEVIPTPQKPCGSATYDQLETTSESKPCVKVYENRNVKLLVRKHQTNNTSDTGPCKKQKLFSFVEESVKNTTATSDKQVQKVLSTCNNQKNGQTTNIKNQEDTNVIEGNKPDLHESSDKMKVTARIRNRSPPSFEVNQGASTSTQNLTRPKLVVKKRVALHTEPYSRKESSRESFEALLSACRLQDSSKDMEKIISKLEKRYNALDSDYAKSPSFVTLLREKYEHISKSRNKLFLYISEVMSEMKAHRSRARSTVEESDDIKSGNLSEQNDRLAEAHSAEEDQDSNKIVDPRVQHKIEVLEVAMRRCNRCIHELEEAEVNFDDEYDSHYILQERYKQRMVELYERYCELTGDEPDAARPYLRPKHLSVTPFPTLNHAIINFVNQKITRRKNFGSKKGTKRIAFTDSLIFPDYQDIWKCVEKCNEEQSLDLTKLEQERIAKKAFVELGEHLQRCRKFDYYDTFSLYLDKEDADPAIDDEELSKKLQNNLEEGTKKLNQVFEKFVEKENEAKARGNLSEAEKSNGNQTDDEAIDGDESDSDEHSVVGSSDVESDTKEEQPSKTDEPAKKSTASDDSDKRSAKVIEIKEQKDSETNKLALTEINPNDLVENVIEINSPLGIEDLETDIEELKTDVITNETLLEETVEKPVESVTELVQNLTTDAVRKIDKTENCRRPDTQTRTESTGELADKDTVKADPPPDINLAVNCTSIPPQENEVIEDETVIEIDENETDKQPVVRLRSFAKTPRSWTDLPKKKEGIENETDPKTLTGSPAVEAVDKFERKTIVDGKSFTNSTQQSTQQNKTSPIGKTVVLSGVVTANLNNRPRVIPNRNIINVKTITNNVTVNLNSQGERVNPAAIQVNSKMIPPIHSVININRVGAASARTPNVDNVNIARKTLQVYKGPGGTPRDAAAANASKYPITSQSSSSAPNLNMKLKMIRRVPIPKASTVVRAIRPAAQTLHPATKTPQKIHVISRDKCGLSSQQTNQVSSRLVSPPARLGIYQAQNPTKRQVESIRSSTPGTRVVGLKTPPSMNKIPMVRIPLAATTNPGKLNPPSESKIVDTHILESGATAVKTRNPSSNVSTVLKQQQSPRRFILPVSSLNSTSGLRISAVHESRPKRHDVETEIIEVIE